MNVIKIKAFGGADQLVLTKMPALSPGPGQVVIGVEASGVGLFDTLIRRGLSPGTLPGVVLGGEVAGTIKAVGEGVEASWLGRRVYAMLRTGGYAEEVAVAVTQLVPLPDELSAADAVGLGINALVAHFALERARMQAGEQVLVRGAGGGIGVMVTQLGVAHGVKVTAVTSSEQRQQQLKKLGATTVVNRTAIAAIADEFDGVIDAVAGEELPTYLTRLAPNGRYVLVGIAGGMPPTDFGMSLLYHSSKSLSLSFLSLDSIPAARLLTAMTELFALATQDKLKAIIDRTYTLVQAADAHRQLESGEVFGKLVLTF